MTTKVVLLQKVRRDRAGWFYMVDRTQYAFAGEGTILDQFVSVVEEIKTTVAPNGEKLIIVSHSLITMVEALIREKFPEITFVKLSEVNLINALIDAFNVPSYKKKVTPKTLYIGSDGSGGHHNTISAWALATSTGYGMGVCAFRDINISEFEGILRSLIENRDTVHPRIQIYSDSKNAIEYFMRIVMNNDSLDTLKGTYFDGLIEEAREVVKSKHVRVEWVRGHRSHRLNTAADAISRHARRSAQSGKNIKNMQIEADAMFTMFAR